MSTATEQKGTSLGQTEIWIDRQGVEHRVEEMSVRYKANVIRFIERRAPGMVARALADKYIEAVGRMFEPVPCVMCPPSAGGGLDPSTSPTRMIHRWEHGVGHLLHDPEKYPDECDAMLPDLPKVTNEEAVELVRRTPLMRQLIEDVEHGRGGQDG